jgi:hypothetical protein
MSSSLRVTLFIIDELLVCRYDPQVGLWPTYSEPIN